ncbi:NrfD/PsrC family molybdoenzyme membrane anchor subunit [Anaeromyxobacter diazotrophicus]|uniref:Polysulfide reductase n=1 Tax=Anaeromyxobacter diazotrophicus TaxID=2590199 RepID=A0A7I9VRG1_9BACT|nr:NrfD/PsrC family molybdoenzyme membrane anchor subunit [Anaeromyxobacter diazotrophicus]GEJ59022.1 polysulfide reductase [Anaeromyxobacter diazotrophicus]
MRARHLPDDRPHDGRNVDPELGALLGEGSHQRVKDLAPSPAAPRSDEVPSLAYEADRGRSYYGLPLLKEPVWRWYVPAYFYVGGVAGAAAALGAAAQLAGWRGSPGPVRQRHPGVEHRLIGRCRLIATAGAGASAVLLIADLGRPARFLDMLRVFRPTSPMNMGTWFLSAFGACCAASTLPHLWPARRPWQRTVSDAAAFGAGVMGLPLCTYTGVLIANTAVPIWHGTRNALPVLFGASGAAGAASLLELWPPGGTGDDVVHRFSLLGKTLELALGEVFAYEARRVPRVARPLRRGASGALWRTAQVLSAAGLAATALSRRGSPLRRTAGLLGTLGALTLRFAILQAGRASARDPLATSEQQRAGRGGAAELTERDRAGASHPALRGVGAGRETEAAPREEHP